MAIRAETRIGVNIEANQIKLGERSRQAMDRITAHLSLLPSFQEAVAKNFFSLQKPLDLSKSPAHSVEFHEEGSSYRVGWSSGEVDSHGFPHNLTLIRSLLTLEQRHVDRPGANIPRIIASAEIGDYHLIDSEGTFLQFTGGSAKLSERFRFKNPDEKTGGRATTTPEHVLTDDLALERLPAVFADLYRSW